MRNKTDAMVGLGEDRKVYGYAGCQSEETERVERLAREFAARVSERKISQAEIFSFLLEMSVGKVV